MNDHGEKYLFRGKSGGPKKREGGDQFKTLPRYTGEGGSRGEGNISTGGEGIQHQGDVKIKKGIDEGWKTVYNRIENKGRSLRKSFSSRYSRRGKRSV